MEWEAPAIILDVRPFGEADAIATVMTEEHGAHRGLARGGASRSARGALATRQSRPGALGRRGWPISSAASPPNWSIRPRPWRWTMRSDWPC